MSGFGWQVLAASPDGARHVVPLDDMRQHVPDECWCEPTSDGDVIVHASADGREAFETGERKVS